MKDSKSDNNAMKVERGDAIGETSDAGFSLLETMFALIIIMIALLGAFSIFVYAINYNAGNKARSQSLAVLQQEAELFRSAKFNSAGTDNFTSPASPGLCRADGRRDLRGRNATSCNVVATNGRIFKVTTTVDNAPLVPNDPATGAPQDESYQCLSPQNTVIPCTLKEVKIEVELADESTGWMKDLAPVTFVLRRVRGN